MYDVSHIPHTCLIHMYKESMSYQHSFTYLIHMYKDRIMNVYHTVHHVHHHVNHQYCTDACMRTRAFQDRQTAPSTEPVTITPSDKDWKRCEVLEADIEKSSRMMRTRIDQNDMVDEYTQVQVCPRLFHTCAHIHPVIHMCAC